MKHLLPPLGSRRSQAEAAQATAAAAAAAMVRLPTLALSSRPPSPPRDEEDEAADSASRAVVSRVIASEARLSPRLSLEHQHGAVPSAAAAVVVTAATSAGGDGGVLHGSAVAEGGGSAGGVLSSPAPSHMMRSPTVDHVSSSSSWRHMMRHGPLGSPATKSRMQRLEANAERSAAQHAREATGLRAKVEALEEQLLAFGKGLWQPTQMYISTPLRSSLAFSPADADSPSETSSAEAPSGMQLDTSTAEAPSGMQLEDKGNLLDAPKSAPKSAAKSLRRRRTCCWFDRGDGSPPQTAPPTTASTLAQPLQRPLASTLAQPLRRPLASTLAQPLRRPASSRSPEGATWMISLIACRRSPEGATWRVRRGRRT